MEDCVEAAPEPEGLISAMQKSKMLFQNHPIQIEHINLAFKDTINNILYLQNREVALIASSKRFIEYDLKNKKILNTVSAHESSVSCLMEIENHYLVVSGGFDGSVILWNSISWEVRKEFVWGGWIYAILPIKQENCVAIIAGMKDDRTDCVIIVWNYQYGEVYTKYNLGRFGLKMLPKFTVHWQENELFVMDNLYQVYLMDLVTGESKEVLKAAYERRPDISCIYSYETRINPSAPYNNALLDQKLKTINPAPDLMKVREKELGLHRRKFPTEYKILLFLGDYKGKISVFIGNRKFKEFTMVMDKRVADEEKMVNEIMIIEPRKKCKIIVVRVGQDFILFDMDFTKLKTFSLPKTAQRILKTKYFANVDDVKTLMFYSVKGDIIIYRLENILKYYFLKLKLLKKNTFHPFVLIEMFKMIFSPDEPSQKQILKYE